MASSKHKPTPPSSDNEPTWPGNGAVLELLRGIAETGKRNEAGINMVSTRLDQIEKDIRLNGQKLGGVMELGGSVLDAKEQMEKSLRQVKQELHALTKAQVRTYDMIAGHVKEDANAAHAPAKAGKK